MSEKDELQLMGYVVEQVDTDPRKEVYRDKDGTLRWRTPKQAVVTEEQEDNQFVLQDARELTSHWDELIAREAAMPSPHNTTEGCYVPPIEARQPMPGDPNYRLL